MPSKRLLQFLIISLVLTLVNSFILKTQLRNSHLSDSNLQNLQSRLLQATTSIEDSTLTSQLDPPNISTSLDNPIIDNLIEPLTQSDIKDVENQTLINQNATTLADLNQTIDQTNTLKQHEAKRQQQQARRQNVRTDWGQGEVKTISFQQLKAKKQQKEKTMIKRYGTRGYQPRKYSRQTTTTLNPDVSLQPQAPASPPQKTEMITGISVGVSCALLIAVGVIVYIYYRRKDQVKISTKYEKKQQTSSLEQDSMADSALSDNGMTVPKSRFQREARSRIPLRRHER